VRVNYTVRSRAIGMELLHSQLRFIFPIDGW